MIKLTGLIDPVRRRLLHMPRGGRPNRNTEPSWPSGSQEENPEEKPTLQTP